MKKNPYAIIVLTILSLIIMVFAFAQPFRLSGNCMEPALRDGKLCFLNRILPLFRPYKIGDIIVFNHKGIVTPSRIIALENDTVQINREGTIVNGITLQNIKTHKNWPNTNNATIEPFKVPANHVFVLSDNLTVQQSFNRAFGPILKSSIMGIIWK